MSCNRIFIQNHTKYASPITSREEYLAMRNDPRNLALLSQARQGDKKAKLNLLQINYSGHYPDCRVKGNRLPSQAYVFDIDSVEDFERIAPELLAHPEKYGLLMLERSVSQGGHAVLRRKSGSTILECQVALATQLQCEIDTNTHDINRVLFTTSASESDLLYLSNDLFADTYDEATVQQEALLLASREAAGEEILPPGAHSANKHFRPWASTTSENSATSATSENPATSATRDRSAKATTPSLPKSDPLVSDNYDNYENIPYAELIDGYWKLFYQGQTPCVGNRDALTYELAYMFRNICGYDRALLDHIIPCYEGFSEEEKLKCIDSALMARRTAMPKKMNELINFVKSKHANDTAIVSSLDEAQLRDDNFYALQLPANLPMGLKESVNAVDPSLAMPVLFAVFPAIGALATGVQMDVHGAINTLNLISYIAGDFASGKGSLDPVINAWMGELQAIDKLYLEKEAVYRSEKKKAKNSKIQPEEPHLPIRNLTLNNTVANLAERLANTEGKHAFSFTPEADTLAAKWRSAMSDFSIMLRQSYDGSPYEREAKSVDAVNVHIEHLLWNVVMAGTTDALFRVVTNYTDGFASRLAIARTPDNTYCPLSEKPYSLIPAKAERIQQVAHLLPLMEGTMVLNKVEARGREWLEKVRMEAMKDDDRVKARLRFRTCVTAQRMIGCMVLCVVAEKLIKDFGMVVAERKLKTDSNLWKKMAENAQTPNVLKCYDIFADYMLDNTMHFFHDRIEGAMNAENYAPNTQYLMRAKNSSIFERLDANFTFEQAYQQCVAAKGAQVTRNTVHQMLKNWKNQGLAQNLGEGKWRKL